MAGKDTSTTRKDWITRTPKWVLLSLFWIFQGVVLSVLQAFLYASQGGVDIDDDAPTYFFGLIPEGLFGRWPPIDDVVDTLIDSEFAISMGIVVSVLTIGQLIFMLPVRKPGLMGKRGHSLKRSLYVSGLVIAALVLASIMTILEYFATVHDVRPDILEAMPGQHLTAIVLIVLLSWSIATPLLLDFTKPGRKETVLARLSKKLFLGTIIEVALLIPLDVMVRRKTDCYCWSGSYWALTLCGFIGVFALGPAVFLPILAKRRKRWYDGHCGVCGYDMCGNLDAPRCPECGTGWKKSPSKTPVT